jgi:hypothetical protein
MKNIEYTYIAEHEYKVEKEPRIYSRIQSAYSNKPHRQLVLQSDSFDARAKPASIPQVSDESMAMDGDNQWTQKQSNNWRPTKQQTV